MEYATRAGATTSWYYGETVELLEKYACIQTNSEDHSWPVGAKKPNDFGFFDMLGNVWCWCQEEFRNHPEGSGTQVFEDDEKMLGTSTTNARVVRGGSFFDRALYVRSADRTRSVPPDRGMLVGFRPARTFAP
jgi:formylglycine-generating enzyme required for sulfatase activity